jgi:hypothetical protein
LKTSISRAGLGRVRIALATGLCIVVAACGGGGGDGGGRALPILPVATAMAPATTAAPGTGTTASPAANVAAISVDGHVNVPYVSVKVCAPGSTTQCQTIDHVILDTGSYGLRLVGSALDIRSALKPQTDGSNVPYAECAQFVSSFAWGSVKVADVSLAGETAVSVPVQVIGDPDFATVPSSCSSAGTPTDTAATFGGNGLLGVGVFRQDCGSDCAGRAIPGTYYACPSAASCVPSTIALALQVTNPVALLPADNNGVMIQLPPVAAGGAGASAVAGSLVLGVGTQANNALGSAQTYGVDNFGNFTTLFSGRTYAGSFIDSGSAFYFFDTNTLPGCVGPVASGLYCPTFTQSLSAINQGTNGANGTVAFNIANAKAEFGGNPAATAFDDIGGNVPGIGGFDWGLPVFFGRSVFVALEGASTAGGNGPSIAY